MVIFHIYCLFRVSISYLIKPINCSLSNYSVNTWYISRTSTFLFAHSTYNLIVSMFAVYLRESLPEVSKDFHVHWTESCESFWATRYDVVPEVCAEKAQLCKYSAAYSI